MLSDSISEIGSFEGPRIQRCLHSIWMEQPFRPGTTAWRPKRLPGHLRLVTWVSPDIPDLDICDPNMFTRKKIANLITEATNYQCKIIVYRSRFETKFKPSYVCICIYVYMCICIYEYMCICIYVYICIWNNYIVSNSKATSSEITMSLTSS